MTQPSLSIKRNFKATPDRVFTTWKDSDLIRRWVFPMQNWTVSYRNEFVVGGDYFIEFSDENGDIHAFTGKYLEIIPNKKIAFTWILVDSTETIITVELHDINGNTEMCLTHKAFPNPEVRNKYYDGWQNCLKNLDELLNSK